LLEVLDQDLLAREVNIGLVVHPTLGLDSISPELVDPRFVDVRQFQAQLPFVFAAPTLVLPHLLDPFGQLVDFLGSYLRQCIVHRPI
jgi:hypothetical protein